MYVPNLHLHSFLNAAKITFPAIVKGPSFVYEELNNFGNDKTTIISPKGDAKYMLGVLNSTVTQVYMEQISSTKQNGYFEYKPVYVSQIPIPNAAPEQQTMVANIVNQIIEARKVDSSADTSSLEAEIDRFVYQIFNLAEDEIELVEETINK